MVTIVEETAEHIPHRDHLLEDAFAGAHHSRTSARLREGRRPADGLALVALDEGEVAGSIRFWHVRAGLHHPALMLGPVAVAAKRRGRGVGASLIRSGLMRARSLGHAAVILVGDVAYYGRFGFAAAWTGDLSLPGPYEPHRFLGLEMRAGALAGATGLVIAAGARIDRAAAPAVAGRDWVRKPLRRNAA